MTKDQRKQKLKTIIIIWCILIGWFQVVCQYNADVVCRCEFVSIQSDRAELLLSCREPGLLEE